MSVLVLHFALIKSDHVSKTKIKFGSQSVGKDKIVDGEITGLLMSEENTVNEEKLNLTMERNE